VDVKNLEGVSWKRLKIILDLKETDVVTAWRFGYFCRCDMVLGEKMKERMSVKRAFEALIYGPHCIPA